MTKVIVEGLIKSASAEKFNVLGICIDNTIKYKYNNELVIIKTFKNKVIISKKDEIKNSIFIFEDKVETMCNYNLYGKSLKLKIFTKKLKITKNTIYIDYVVENSQNIILSLNIKGDNYDN